MTPSGSIGDTLKPSKHRTHYSAITPSRQKRRNQSTCSIDKKEKCSRLALRAVRSVSMKMFTAFYLRELRDVWEKRRCVKKYNFRRFSTVFEFSSALIYHFTLVRRCEWRGPSHDVREEKKTVLFWESVAKKKANGFWIFFWCRRKHENNETSCRRI